MECLTESSLHLVIDVSESTVKDKMLLMGTANRRGH